jgi:hypothetical protein
MDKLTSSLLIGIGAVTVHVGFGILSWVEVTTDKPFLSPGIYGLCYSIILGIFLASWLLWWVMCTIIPTGIRAVFAAQNSPMYRRRVWGYYVLYLTSFALVLGAIWTYVVRYGFSHNPDESTNTQDMQEWIFVNRLIVITSFMCAVFGSYATYTFRISLTAVPFNAKIPDIGLRTPLVAFTTD